MHSGLRSDSNSSLDLTLTVNTEGMRVDSVLSAERDAERERTRECELVGLGGKGAGSGRETPGSSPSSSKHELHGLRIVTSLWSSVSLDGK